MKFYKVNRPLQTNSDLNNVQMFDDIRYSWCVKTYQYLDSCGGIKQWFKEIKKVKPDIVFFYSLESEPITFPDGKRDKVTYIRAELFNN
jgi:hypothetical protein